MNFTRTDALYYKTFNYGFTQAIRLFPYPGKGENPGAFTWC